MSNPRKALNQFVDNLIRENKSTTSDGYQLTVDKLHRLEKEDFAAHLIACDTTKKDGWEWLNNASVQDELSQLFAASLLSYGSKQTEIRDRFFECMRNAAVETLRGRMQDVIDERISDVFQEDQYELKHPADDWDYQEARL